MPLENLTKEKFAEALNTRFRIIDDSAEPVELQLVAVTAGVPAFGGPEAAQYENFSLMFEGSSKRFLPQKMYSFEHDTMGSFALFIVPVGREGNVFKYQAVFNRPIKAA